MFMPIFTVGVHEIHADGLLRVFMVGLLAASDGLNTLLVSAEL